MGEPKPSTSSKKEVDLQEPAYRPGFCTRDKVKKKFCHRCGEMFCPVCDENHRESCRDHQKVDG